MACLFCHWKWYQACQREEQSSFLQNPLTWYWLWMKHDLFLPGSVFRPPVSWYVCLSAVCWAFILEMAWLRDNPQSILLVMQEANSYESRLGHTPLTVRRKKKKEKRKEEFVCKIKHKAHQQVKHNSQCFHTAVLLLFYVHSASCFIHKRSLLTPSIYKPWFSSLQTARLAPSLLHTCASHFLGILLLKCLSSEVLQCNF